MGEMFAFSGKMGGYRKKLTFQSWVRRPTGRTGDQKEKDTVRSGDVQIWISFTRKVKVSGASLIGLEETRCQPVWPLAKTLKAQQMMLQLQTAHSHLQQQAVDWTAFLQRHLGPHHYCFCNPGPAKVLSHHVCLPLWQLAMLYLRLQPEAKTFLFVPWLLDNHLLRQYVILPIWG